MNLTAPKTPAQPNRVGTGMPSAGLGNNGDTYLRRDTGRTYEKVGGVWGLILQATINVPDMAPQPSCRAYRTSIYTLTGPGWVPIPFDLESWDTDNIHDTVTNNTRMTCKTAGVYLVTAGGHISGASGTGTLYGLLARNGSVAAGELWGEEQFGPTPTSNDFRIPAMTGVFNLAVNDWVEMYFYYNVAGSCSVDNQGEGVTHISMTKIS